MPFDPVLTLETAALLLVAFLVGAIIGSLLRLAILRLRQAPTVAATAAPVPHAVAAEALVAAPVIAPLSVPRDPVMPTEIPVPDFVEATVSAPSPVALAPARKPGVATFGRDVGRHDRQRPPANPETTTAPDVEAPAPHIEPSSPPLALSEPVAVVTGTEEPATVDDITVATAVPEQSSDSSEPPAPSSLDVTAELLAIAPSVDVASEQAVPVAPALSAADAEAAAMRAIEGSWTPGRRTQPAAEVHNEPIIETPAPAVSAPVGDHDKALLDDVAVAVLDEAAAHDAADQAVPDGDQSTATIMESPETPEVPDVLPQHEEDRIVPAEATDEPEPEPEPDRRTEPEFATAPLAIPPAAQDQPPGLGAPRYGMRDDLTQIVGVLPVVETTLNRIGVYHFDQVADWSDGHAGWVEAHLGIAGRVDREQWREQARELAAIASGKRPSRKKHPN